MVKSVQLAVEFKWGLFKWSMMLFRTQRDIEQVYIAIKWENLQLDNVKFVTLADRSPEIHGEGSWSIINPCHCGRSKIANGFSWGQSSVGEWCGLCSGCLISAIHFNSLGFKYSVELQMEIIWSCETALSLLVFMLFWLTPRKVWRKPGICYNRQLQTCPGRWLQMVADFPGWEKAKKALVVLPAFLHF